MKQGQHSALRQTIDDRSGRECRPPSALREPLAAGRIHLHPHTCMRLKRRRKAVKCDLRAQKSSSRHRHEIDLPLRRIDKLAKATTEEKRFYALDAAAKISFEVGKIDEASKYAQELKMLLSKFKDNWNYGNAIQDTNLVMGRIALSENRAEDAKEYLLNAGRSPGSPQMDTFGPNMSLAEDLLGKGERETVLQYFELCRKFWRMNRGRLDAWRDAVKAGRIPDFGPNLLY